MTVRIAIVTDSTCDLPSELAAARGIEIVPQVILWGTESYKDGVELPSAEFYARLGRESELPKTSQPSPAEFAEAYEQARANIGADAVVCITLSSKLSGTYNAAEAARAMVDFPVQVVDSHNVTMGLGFAALAAADARDQGRDVGAVCSMARQVGKNAVTLFTLDTLEFLHRGGRIGGAQRLIGTALSIKPILQVADGEVTSTASVRTRKRALARLLEIGQSRARTNGPLHMAVIQGVAEDDADCLAEDAQRLFAPLSLIRSTLCSTLGVHTGPGVVGCTFIDAY